MQYEPIIGLEIHVELCTQSKMFCSCGADWFGREPNTLTCPVCLALPGALPVPNEVAIEWALRIARALGCEVNRESKFDRKHYFYPDLPKGYQISQYDKPFGIHGKLDYSVVDFQTHEVTAFTGGITRVHLEEDTGKLTHRGSETLVDYNRAGVPLVEIVTEPDFQSAAQVKAFLEELHAVIRQLGVSDVNMEQGSMRLEPNISVRLVGETELPNYKVEVKNINSFRYAAAAVDYEIARHIEILERGETPIQETRGYAEDKKVTVSQRVKEDAHDYRYFPEPDIPPIHVSDELLEKVNEEVEKHIQPAKTASARYDSMITAGIPVATAFQIAYSEELQTLFGTVERILRDVTDPTQRIFMVNHYLNNPKTPYEELSQQWNAKQGEVSSYLSKEDVVEQFIKPALEADAELVEKYKSGNVGVINSLIGPLMGRLKGKVDPKNLREWIEGELQK